MFIIGKIFLTVLWIIASFFVLTKNSINFSPFLKENFNFLLTSFIIIHLIQYSFFFRKLKKGPYRGYHFFQVLFFGMIHVREFKKK